MLCVTTPTHSRKSFLFNRAFTDTHLMSMIFAKTRVLFFAQTAIGELAFGCEWRNVTLTDIS